MGRSKQSARWMSAIGVAVGVALWALPAFAENAGGSGEPMMLPEPTAQQAVPPQEGLPADSYVAEVIDSTFFVGPAEFFALDLPTRGATAQATHLSGSATAMGKGDIIIRLFSGVEYDRWLKKRGGPAAKPFWVSPKSKTVNLQQPLPVGQAVVMLLDNGYSIRTPKRVHVQLQIQYRRTDGSAAPRVATDAPAPKREDDIVTPRSNEEDLSTPPPPPPTDDSGQ